MYLTLTLILLYITAKAYYYYIKRRTRRLYNKIITFLI
jgi:hypothetical protein